jgi:hypothetical protein
MQGKLFDMGSPDMTPLKAMSHTNDPQTSKDAAQHHYATGQRAKNATLVLRLLERHPGLTAVELWEAATVAEQLQLKEMQEIRRRLTELAADKLAAPGDARICRVRGTRQATWNAAGI